MADSKTVTAIIAHGRQAERAEAYFRLVDAIGTPPGVNILAVNSTVGPPSVWSLAQWQHGISCGLDYVLCLNDDMMPCADVWTVLANVLAARPNHIVNLYNSHPGAIDAANKGLRWYTSVDGLIGNAYVMPTPVLQDFLTWRSTVLIPGAVELLSEDQLINLYAMYTGALIWHTVPALFDHDTSVPSLYGNTQLRRPQVGPKPDMHAIEWDTDAVHIGRQFRGNHWGLVRFMKPEYRMVERAYEIDRQTAA